MVLTAEPFIKNPSLEGAQKAIRKLNTNNGSGKNLINTEMIKAGSLKLAIYLHKLIRKIWINKTIPEERNVGIICPIYKKEGAWKTNNYGGIALQNVFYKSLANVMHSRIEGYIENLLEDY